MAPGHRAKGIRTNPSPKLTPAQLIFLYNLLADGLNSQQVNQAASHFRPPFVVTARQLTYYRKKMGAKHQEMMNTAAAQGWAEGLARKEERVRVLKRLAERLIRDLLVDDPAAERVWLDNIKGLGSGAQFTTFNYKDFNHQEMIQLRGVLEDIAHEVGQRSSKVEVTTVGGATGAQVRIPAEAIAPDFLSVYRDLRARAHMEYLLYGGRGSTKSSFTSLSIIETLVNNPDIHGVAMRQVANTMRDSVYAQLSWAIGQLGLTDQFKCTTSPLEIEYLPTHQKVYFRGADDPGKLKSIKPAFGYVGILWLEELDQFRGPEAVRKIEQSVIRGGDLAWVFKTYNPPRTSGNWVNKYVQTPKANQLQHRSSYLTVPREWLGQVFVDEAEHLRDVNPAAYEHEYLGIVNGTGGQVFENVRLRAITDEEIHGRRDLETGLVVGGFDRIHEGIDWGFYPDPFDWVKVHYDAARLTLYIFNEYRALKKSNKLAWEALVKERGVTGADSIIADSAEPKSVADLREYGANIRGAEKGPESVAYSMKWLQSLREIVIDPVRAPNAAHEFIDYELEQDKDGEYISEYPDKNNHSIDATRYAMNLVWRRRGE
jgi:phage terminase large subunit